MVNETKFDSGFPESQHKISGYILFHEDRNQHRGGLIFVTKQDILYKATDTFNFPDSLEVLPSEINIKNKKIHVIGCYKPPSLNNDTIFLNQLHGDLSFCSTIYDNFL